MSNIGLSGATLRFWMIATVAASVPVLSPILLSGQEQSERYNEALWVAHASFQANRRDDLITPLLIKAMVREARKNPSASYEALAHDAAELRTKFGEEVNYANTGKLPDPFVREKEIAEWAKTLASHTKNPLASGLAEAADLTFKAGTALTLHITALDETQQLEYRDLLYRQSLANVDDTFAAALEEGKRNPRLAAAINAVSGPSLGVQLNDSPERIQQISPEVTAALNTKEILDILRSGGTNVTALKVVERRLNSIQSETSRSYQLLKKIVETSEDTVRQQRAREEMQLTLERQKLQIEAGRASILIISKVLSFSAPEAAERIQMLGDTAIRAWEAIRTYEANLSLNGTVGLSEAVLMGNLVGVMFGAISAFSPHGEDEMRVLLKEINELKSMISDLYTLTIRRFDRLELIMESYQKMNSDAFSILIVQNSINAEQLDSVRTALFDLSHGLQILSRKVDANVRGLYKTQFSELQRKCYLEHSLLGGESITRVELTNCLRKFANYAISTSGVQPFIDRDTSTVKETEQAAYLSGDPYSKIPYLLRTAKMLGSSGAMAASTVGNPAIWSNAILAYAATLSEWPKLVTAVDRARLSDLVRYGEHTDQAIASMFVSPNEINYKLFQNLTKLYADRVIAVGAAAQELAVQYAAQYSGSINPFEYGIMPLGEISPDDDKTFARTLPSKIRRCGQDKALPDFIDTPPGITKRIPVELRLGARLDPAGHSIDLCYELAFTERKVFRWVGPVFAGYIYFGPPWLIVHLRSTERDDPDGFLAIKLPDMIFAQGPTPITEYDAKPAGDYVAGQYPPALTFKKGYRYDHAFREWLETDSLGKFSEQASIGRQVGNTYTFFHAGTRSFFAATDKFNEARIEEHRGAAAQFIVRHFSSAGPLADRIAQLSGTKRLLAAYLQLLFPISFEGDVNLQSAFLTSLQVYDGDLEWQSLVGFGRRPKQLEWYRLRWKPRYSRPESSSQANSESLLFPPTTTSAGIAATSDVDKIKAGVEDLVVIGITKRLWDDSIIGQNYSALQQAIAETIYRPGGLNPEPSPIFACTLGIVKPLLKPGNPGKANTHSTVPRTH